MANRKVKANKVNITNPEIEKQRRIQKLDGYQEKYISCQCKYVSHLLILTYFVSLDKSLPQWEELEISVYLNKCLSFFKRLWYGIKYIFGFDVSTPPFDNIVLSVKEAEDMRDFLDEYVAVMKHHRKEKENATT